MTLPSPSYKQHAVEVAAYNLLSYIHEVERGSAYSMTKARPFIFFFIKLIPLL